MGELVVESSEAAIKSIELQLVRVETCGKGPPGCGESQGTPLDARVCVFEKVKYGGKGPGRSRVL